MSTFHAMEARAGGVAQYGGYTGLLEDTVTGGDPAE